MKIRITLLFAVLLFGISFYSCSNDDETPEQETVAEEENQEDSDENADDDTEGDSGDGTDDEEGSENDDTSDEEGSDGGSGEGEDTDSDGSDGDGNGDSGDGNGDSGDGNGDSGDGNGDSGDGNGDSGDGNGDSGDGNGDSGGGNGDSGDNAEEEGNTDDVGPVINVTAPQDGQVFQQGDQVNVDTDISDDSNIAFARLFINGMLLRQENVAPYQWGTNNPNDAMLSSLAPGNYMLNVVAEDEFGNSSESTLSITVEAGSGDEDSGTGDGGNGDGGNGDGGNGDGGNGDGGNGDGGNGNPTTSCSNPQDAEFLEENGLVVVEFENNSFPGNWDFRTNVSDFQGSGFMVWTGSQSFNNPGNGLVRFKIRIQNPGTYRFIWRSAVTIGDNGTEHNDTWLRFNDADDYFGRKSSNGNIVYPRGTGKTPNPNGSSKDGWFKIYRSGNNLGFKWQSSTSDNDGHNIFVTFNSPGVYTMEVSARSSGHAIDRFVLFDEDDYSPNQATSASNPVSAVNCN